MFSTELRVFKAGLQARVARSYYGPALNACKVRRQCGSQAVWLSGAQWVVRIYDATALWKKHRSSREACTWWGRERTTLFWGIGLAYLTLPYILVVSALLTRDGRKKRNAQLFFSLTTIALFFFLFARRAWCLPKSALRRKIILHGQD